MLVRIANLSPHPFRRGLKSREIGFPNFKSQRIKPRDRERDGERATERKRETERERETEKKKKNV